MEDILFLIFYFSAEWKRGVLIRPAEDTSLTEDGPLLAKFLSAEAGIFYFLFLILTEPKRTLSRVGRGSEGEGIWL